MANGYQNAGLRVFMTSPRSVLPNVIKQRQMSSVLKLHSRRLGAWANLLTCWCWESCETSRPLVCIWWFGVIRERSCCCVSTYLCRMRNLIGPLSPTGQVDRLTLAAHSGVEPKLSMSRLSQQSNCMQVHLLRSHYTAKQAFCGGLLVTNFGSISSTTFKLFSCQQQSSNKVALVWPQGSVCLISKIGLEVFRLVTWWVTPSVVYGSAQSCFAYSAVCFKSSDAIYSAWLLPVGVLTLLSQVLVLLVILCIVLGFFLHGYGDNKDSWLAFCHLLCSDPGWSTPLPRVCLRLHP